jgi:hypothetical protein
MAPRHKTVVIGRITGAKTHVKGMIMKKFVFVFCVSLCVAGTAAGQTKEELQKMYADYLRKEGYAPSLDSDGDVSFKIEGGNYFIAINEDDPVFFYIGYPNFWEIETEAERRKASAVIMNVNRTTKVAKIYITSRDDTWIEASIFLNAPEDFKRHFLRMIDAVQLARRKFIDGMNDDSYDSI